MNNLEQRRERFMKDSLPVRLGGLAANLARISSFVKNPANLETVKGLIEESKFFIEWTASELSAEKASDLAKLQIELALLQRSFETDWESESSRSQIGLRAKEWSRNVLQSSGLI